MSKEDFLKLLAETGYNVGFGAKKHYATYDIVDKVPGLIGLTSMAFGVYALVFDSLTASSLSATFIVLGIIGLYISFYDPKKDKYEIAGKELTRVFNDLNKLYRQAKVADSSQLLSLQAEFQALVDRFYSSSISKQILFSDWYAHYKFFWQHQIDWIDEQKKFSLLRDKIPLTFSLPVVFLLLAYVIWRFESALALAGLSAR